MTVRELFEYCESHGFADLPITIEHYGDAGGICYDEINPSMVSTDLVHVLIDLDE